MKPTLEDVLKLCKWIEDKHKRSEQFFWANLDNEDFPEGYAEHQGLKCGYAAAIARIVQEFIAGDPVAVEAFHNIDSYYLLWEDEDA